MNSKSDYQELKLMKLEKEINAMKNNQLINELKKKSLPVFGTIQQKRERLRNYYGLGGNKSMNTKAPSTSKLKVKKGSTLAAIDKINQNREIRRRKMEEKKKIKLEKQVSNQEQGIK